MPPREKIILENGAMIVKPGMAPKQTASKLSCWTGSQDGLFRGFSNPFRKRIVAL
jgi:hypothetical protein